MATGSSASSASLDLYKHRSFSGLVLVLFLAALGVANGTPAVGQSTAADIVYGQGGSFASNTQNNGGISASSIASPAAAAQDSAGNLYVVDQYNSRALFYPAGSTTATRVYGQGGSFTSNAINNGGVSANSLAHPSGVIVDNSGNLYISDGSNNRVLFYPSSSTTPTRVYGQSGSFTSNGINNGGVSANSLSQPTGLALDSSGNLYVADQGNGRVLFYPSGSTTATVVYGQGGSFTSSGMNSGGVTANSLAFPQGLALDASGNLYVADVGNSRVVFYSAGSTTATQVYGQGGSFTSSTKNNGGVSANSLSSPQDAALDKAGNLYVSDYDNNRVLFYSSGSTTASRVYGQGGSFTTFAANNGGIGASSLSSPFAVTLDSSGNLYVADYGNNRVLLYPPTTTPGIYAPVNGSTLASYSVTFWWAGYPGATNYWLDLGSTAGGNNYLQSGSLPNTTYSQTVVLPRNASPVYATWWYELGGTWQNIETSYTAFGATGSAIATLVSPTPNGSTLSGSSQTFTWQAGTDAATDYWIDVGSTAGGNNYYQSGSLPTSTLSQTVSGLPLDGSAIYVTLYSLVGGGWLSNSYNFYAASSINCLATITSPVAGTTLAAYSAAVSWTPSTNPACAGLVTNYWLDAGTTATENFYSQSGPLGLVTSSTAANLPPGYGGGQTPPNWAVGMTLWNLVSGTWVASPQVGYCAHGQSGYPNCNSCTPTTCAAQGGTCGTMSDGCAWTLNCGTCSGESCGESPLLPNLCGLPTTCAQMGAICGEYLNGCGSVINCGTCAQGQYCDTSSRTCVSTASCTPTTCAAQGKNCGTISDGCGGTLSCGTCSGGQVCDAVTSVCEACQTKTCSSLGYTCGTEVSNGCGGVLNCGTCPTGEVCTNGSCGTVLNDSNLCQSDNAVCGSVRDACSAALTCGTCGAGQECNSNQCCTPLTQSAACQGVACGTAPDGCGGTVSCTNTCAAGQTCKSDTCCTPLTQSTACQGVACGTVSNGCGGTITCTDSCTGSQTCQSNNCCTPFTQSAACQGLACGNVSNGCGGTIACSNTCTSGQTCDGNSCCTPNANPCQGLACGTASNGCGGMVSCGTCGEGTTCTSGQCQSCNLPYCGDIPCGYSETVCGETIQSCACPS